GGARRTRTVGSRIRGRSPRGRRSHLSGGRRGLSMGSISARAEEPASSSAVSAMKQVDLRAGGGALSTAAEASLAWGRSPRGRRSRAHGTAGEARPGSISARAEEPLPLKKLILFHLSKNTSQTRDWMVCEQAANLHVRQDPSAARRGSALLD